MAAIPPPSAQGLLSIDESPNVLNPPNGWVFNVNNWPWSAAGPGNSPKKEDYPAYVENSNSESGARRPCAQDSSRAEEPHAGHLPVDGRVRPLPPGIREDGSGGREGVG